MAKYSLKRDSYLYNPASEKQFRISRSKLELFLKCERCFYLDVKLGVRRPSMPGFLLNTAVDHLLKKEFDIHRAKNAGHPLMKAYGIDAVPLTDEKLDEWRDSLHRGITCEIEGTNVVMTGGIDDVWVKPDGELIIVDYKATAIHGEVTLDGEYKEAYKRQIEIYQWLFRQNGKKVSNTAYFVYCNGNMDKDAFDGELEFIIKLIPYEGNDSWVKEAIDRMCACLKSATLPAINPECEYCSYVQYRIEKEMKRE